MKLKITSLMVLLGYSNAVCGATTSQLSNAMVKYCVPASAGTCTDRATYRSITNTCVCGLGKYYSGRKCNKCAPGTYADKDDLTSCKTCPAGTCATSEESQSCKSCGSGAATCDAKTCEIKSCQSGFTLQNGKCKFYKEYKTPGNYTIHLSAGTYKITVAGAGGGAGGNIGCCARTHHAGGFLVCKEWAGSCKYGGGSGGAGGRGEGIIKTLNINTGDYNIVVGKAGGRGGNNDAPNKNRVVVCGVYGSTTYCCTSPAGNGGNGGSSKFYNITAKGGNGGTGAWCYNDWGGGGSLNGCKATGRNGSAGSGYSGGASGGSHGWVIIESV